ncbi:HNH endonuclease [Anaerotruncus colihominis]|uniref:HNH endonuclease signature motif containing protein n=1 Tax=Anaerotruncus colihominis TaxID=169435 RepID=UPI0035186AEB
MKCAVCGKYLTSCKDIERFLKLGQGLYHIGHIVPVSQGGCDAIENLRLTCPECNLKRKETFAFEAILKETNGSDFPVSPQLAANCGGLRPESNPNPIQSKSESKSMRGAESSSTPSVAELPLNDGTVYAVSVEQCQKWAGLYPAVDVIQQLRAMTGWLDANPTKRKTRHGIERFINAWLAKDQDRGGVRHAADRGRNPIFEVPCGTTGRNKPTLGTVLE